MGQYCCTLLKAEDIDKLFSRMHCLCDNPFGLVARGTTRVLVCKDCGVATGAYTRYYGHMTAQGFWLYPVDLYVTDEAQVEQAPAAGEMRDVSEAVYNYLTNGKDIHGAYIPIREFETCPF